MNSEQETTVPPAIRFRFTEFVTALSDAAKIDYSERPSYMHEWMLRLQYYWRREFERLDADAAADAALRRFGDLATVARVFRGGPKMLWHRMLYFERYKVHRQLLPMALCIFHDWLRVSGSATYTIVSTRSLAWSFLVPDWTYYSSLLLVAFTIVSPWAGSRVPSCYQWLIRCLGLVIATCVLLYMGKQWFDGLCHLGEQWMSGRWHRPDVEDTPIWADALAGIMWSLALLLEGVLLAAVAPLVFSEIWGFPVSRRSSPMHYARVNLPS